MTGAGYAAPAVLIAALAALAVAAPVTTYDECPKLNATTYVRAHGTSCRVARGVARAWDGTLGDRPVKGFTCRSGRVGTYHGRPGIRVTCGKGSARVQFDRVHA